MTVIPDDPAGEDRIGYGDHGEGLVQMIRTVEARGSFTIGVYGRWGQGKTSMLRQIKKSLDERGIRGDQEVITVWFNPWRYAGEKFLIVPFFHTLVAALEDYKKCLEEMETAGKLSSSWKVLRNKLITFGQTLSRVPVALAYGLEGEIKVPLLLKAKFNFQRFIDEGRRQEAKIEAQQAEESAEDSNKMIEEHESLYYNLIEELQRAVDDFDTKVVVFIDDLDRCLPEKAVELLEGLKVLLDLRNFVFVIGVAREVVERGIRVRYRELYAKTDGDGPRIERDYLEKIIQFPLTLPPADKQRLSQHIREDYMADLPRAHPYLDTILEAIDTIPRNLKRYINAVAFTMWIADRRKGQGQTDFRDELLIKMSLIGFLLPELYKQLTSYPHHLLFIQEKLWEREREEQEKTVDSRDEPPDDEFPDAKAIREMKDSEKAREELKTGIREVDHWLERPHVDKLKTILKKRSRQWNGKELKDQGFRLIKEVSHYVSLATPALESKVESKNLIAAIQKGATVSLEIEMGGRLVHIPGGSFQLGDDSEGSYEATVTGFEMDKYPVTQSLYERVMGINPSRFEGDDRPVEQVSWIDAVTFCNRLSKKTGRTPYYYIAGEEITGNTESDGFRLPTEAEWEYACRAGTEGERYGEIDEIAWYKSNSEGTTHGVGQKHANKFKLHDMLGNVWEWVWDWFAVFPEQPPDGYAGPKEGGYRVIRGGGFGNGAQYCRAADRSGSRPAGRRDGLGFRLSRSLS